MFSIFHSFLGISVAPEPCEEEELEAEAGSPDIEPGTEMDQGKLPDGDMPSQDDRFLLLQYFILYSYVSIPDDIPSDAEAEARLHQSEHAEALPEEDKRSESVETTSSIGTCH